MSIGELSSISGSETSCKIEDRTVTSEAGMGLGTRQGCSFSPNSV